MLKTTTYKSPSLVFTLKIKVSEDAPMGTDETKKADRPLFIEKHYLILKVLVIVGL